MVLIMTEGNSSKWSYVLIGIWFQNARDTGNVDGSFSTKQMIDQEDNGSLANIQWVC